MATNHICAVCGKACENQRTGYWKKQCENVYDPTNPDASPAGYVKIFGELIHLCKECNGERKQKEYAKKEVMPVCTMCGCVCESKRTGYHSYGGVFVNLCKTCSKEHHNYHDTNSRPRELRKKIHRPKPKQITEIKGNTSTCSILKQHAEVLGDDPERLSTDFIKLLMGTDPKC